MTAPAELVHVIRNGLVESVHTGDVAVCDADGRVLAVGGRSRATPLRSLVREAGPGRGVVPRDGRAGRSARRSGRGDVRLPQRGAAPRGSRPPTAPTRIGPRLGAAEPAGPDAGWEPVADPRQLLREARGDARRFGAPRMGPRDLSVPLASAPAPGDQGGGRRDGGRAPRVRRGRVRPPGARRHAPGDGHDVRRLSAPERMGGLATAVDRSCAACSRSPFIVGGTGRLDTDVMTAGAGRMIAKEGAEGLVCATSLGQGLGVASRSRTGAGAASARRSSRCCDELEVRRRGLRRARGATRACRCSAARSRSRQRRGGRPAPAIRRVR